MKTESPSPGSLPRLVGRLEADLQMARQQVERYTKHPDEYCSRAMWLVECGRLERQIEAAKSSNI